MPKYKVATPDLAKIWTVKSHAEAYLKQHLRTESWDSLTVRRLFQTWYHANPEKREILLRPSAVLTRGTNTEFNTPCFLFDNIAVSSKLSKPTPESRLNVALRQIEWETRPNDLKRHGYEMDHQNSGGFSHIARTFIDAHGLQALCSALTRTDLNAIEMGVSVMTSISAPDFRCCSYRQFSAARW